MRTNHSKTLAYGIGLVFAVQASAVFAGELVAVSEPGPMGLLALGALALFLAGRFKRNR